MTTASLEQGTQRIKQFLEGCGKQVSAIDHQLITQAVSENQVAEYTATLAQGSATSRLSLIAKFYGDERGATAYAAMRALSSALSASDPLAVPGPYFYDGQCGLLVQQKVLGKAGPQLLEGEDPSNVAANIGRALACLHCQREVGATVKTMSDHIEELVRPAPTVLADAYPEYRSLIEVALEMLYKHEWSSATSAATPLHRDFQLRQMFLADGRVWLVDWDTFALGDPAFDVAYFLVYLRTHYKCNERLQGGFLEGYLATQSDAVLDRLSEYKAFNYLRRACRRFRVRDKDWESEMRGMLQLVDMAMSKI